MSESECVPTSTRHKRRVAHYTQQDDTASWFQAIYQSAQGQEAVIPWVRKGGNLLLVEWLALNHCDGAGKRALVVGCGLGDDAEALARYGFAVTAFDVAPAAIQWCRRRYPASSVRYAVANLLALPDAWTGPFDFIVEASTLQVLPEEAQREAAAAQLARCLAPDGSLLVICRGREAHEAKQQMPWPLTRADLQMFERLGLREITFEDIPDARRTPIRHFRALYQR